MKRVGVYIDYGNVYHGARSAFALDGHPGYVGNINPSYLAKRLALQSADAEATPRRDTHELTHVKVFRGAPEPRRDPIGALLEAKRVEQWKRWGCKVIRHAVDYGSGTAVEKGLDIALATELLMDVTQGGLDLVILVSADKDYVPVLNRIRTNDLANVETGIWVAKPGAERVGRIRLAPDAPDLGEAPFHGLREADFRRVRDETDYRWHQVPDGWNGPTPWQAHRGR